MTYCDCVTAEDAMAKARAVAQRRRTVFGPARPDHKEFKYLPEISMSALIKGAYPAAYPRRGLKLRTTVPEILTRIAEEFGFREMDLISQRKTGELIFPRHLIMALACELTTKSLPSIGRLLGSKNHTTILSARNKMKPLIDEARVVAGVTNNLDVWIAECRRLEPTVKAVDDRSKRK